MKHTQQENYALQAEMYQAMRWAEEHKQKVMYAWAEGRRETLKAQARAMRLTEAGDEDDG